MDDIGIRARRAAGETLHQIAESLGVSHVAVFRAQWGGRKRKPVGDTERSYVKHKMQIGKCSTDFAVIPISLARSAAHYG